MIRISVVICTHNPRIEYLHRVLDALERQTLDKGQWELLLVDNCSTQPLSLTLDLSWQPSGRHLQENVLGLTRARLCGIAAARGELLIFVDDDNVLDPDYLAVCDRIADEFPFLGAWGGQSIPEFEMPPPDYAKPYLGHLALRNLDKISWANIPFCADSTPVGAGMCIRAEVANTYCATTISSEVALNLGRAGNRLISCDDLDLAFTACDLGFGTGLFPALKLTHLIPKERLEKRYLLRLLEGFGYSYTLLRHSRGYAIEAPARDFVRQGVSVARQFLHAIRGEVFRSQAQAAKERGTRQALAEISRLPSRACE